MFAFVPPRPLPLGADAPAAQRIGGTMEPKPFGTAPDTREGRIRRRAWRFALPLVRFFLRRKYNYVCTPLELEGPFLLIANHANNADPLFISQACPQRPLTYVASEHLERLGLVTGLLTRYFSIIPRKKASSAVGTVRAILTALRRGESVVLFAEGDCTWDGVSAPIFPATGKLARSAGVPLVTYRLEGNYLSCPRWAKTGRRGRCVGAPVGIYSPRELASMKPEQVTAAIDRDIFEDAWQTQKRVGVDFRCRAPALGLERALFLCPDCGAAGGLRTRGREIFCTGCGMHARLDRQGFFQSGPYPDILAWDRWQKERFAHLITEGQGGHLFPGEGRLTDLGENSPRRVRFCLDAETGSLLLDGESLRLEEISEMAMVKTDRLLFSAGGRYYELRSKRAILRPYLLAWQTIRANLNHMEEKP